VQQEERRRAKDSRGVSSHDLDRSELRRGSADGVENEHVERARGLRLDGVARGPMNRVVSRLVRAIVRVVPLVRRYRAGVRMEWFRADVREHHDGAENDQEPGRASPSSHAVAV